ncbi:MAG: N-acetylmuramoyl-L-alanine amidase [Lachnospiraceae bacterium]|nr:N-acetylmuramoyl-L-alanine amidase [Lachnospiraceae bacterium]
MVNKLLRRASIGSLVLLFLTVVTGLILGDPVDESSWAVTMPEKEPAVVQEQEPEQSDPARPEDAQTVTEYEPWLADIVDVLGECDTELIEKVADSCVVINKDFFAKGVKIKLEPLYVERILNCEFSNLMSVEAEPSAPFIVRLQNRKIYTSELEDRDAFDEYLEQEAAEEKQAKATETDRRDRESERSGRTTGYIDTLQVVFDKLFPGEDPVICREIRSNGGRTKIEFTMRKTTEYEVLEDEHFFYIRCVDPRELYDFIVVLDAGHGGTDPGALADCDKVMEKDLNLDIVLRLKKLLDADERIRTYYTRTADRKLTLMQRVRLANDLSADAFISVHCNSAKSSQVGGTEVLYSQYYEGEKLSSKDLANICLEKVNELYPLMNRGIVPRGDDVLILAEAKCPAALLETAYISNPSNRKSITTPESRQAVAEGLYEAILEVHRR